MAGDHAVAEDVLLVEPEFRRAMRDESIQLNERSRIEQEIESFARRQLAPRVLALDPDGSPAEQRLGSHPIELGQPFFIRRHRRRTSRCPCAKTDAIIVVHIDLMSARRCLTLFIAK